MIKKYLRRFRSKVLSGRDHEKVLMGSILSELNARKQRISSLHDVEFKVFSQWGDDGIIQYLVSQLNISNKTFVEFGVETYHESNTRFLLMKDNWKGLIIDGGLENINYIKAQDIYWRYGLSAECSFITRNNINDLLSRNGFQGDIGILSIDIDGNDYWVAEAIDVVSPAILIMEYNSVFGKTRAITVPYEDDFVRSEKHYSNLYYGVSLKAAEHLAQRKGYVFVGCNSNGNNAYFIRKDKYVNTIPIFSVEEGFVDAMFKESRSRDGRLTFKTGESRVAELKGMPVVNVISKTIESL